MFEKWFGVNSVKNYPLPPNNKLKQSELHLFSLHVEREIYIDAKNSLKLPTFSLFLFVSVWLLFSRLVSGLFPLISLYSFEEVRIAVKFSDCEWEMYLSTSTFSLCMWHPVSLCVFVRLWSFKCVKFMCVSSVCFIVCRFQPLSSWNNLWTVLLLQLSSSKLVSTWTYHYRSNLDHCPVLSCPCTPAKETI